MISATAGPSFFFLSLFLSFFFFAVFYLFNHATTCSLASGGAAADEQTGRVGLRRKDLFHCGLLWEHTAPLMSEWKTSGGGIK